MKKMSLSNRFWHRAFIGKFKDIHDAMNDVELPSFYLSICNLLENVCFHSIVIDL